MPIDTVRVMMFIECPSCGGKVLHITVSDESILYWCAGCDLEWYDTHEKILLRMMK